MPRMGGGTKEIRQTMLPKEIHLVPRSWPGASVGSRLMQYVPGMRTSKWSGQGNRGGCH